MKSNVFKRVMSVGFCLILTLSLSACQNNKTPESSKNGEGSGSAMTGTQLSNVSDNVVRGRYVEKVLQLPSEFQDGPVLKMNMEENQIVLYAGNDDSVYRLVWGDNETWSKEAIDLGHEPNDPNGITVQDVAVDESGNRYVLVGQSDENVEFIHYSIYRQSNSSEELLPISLPDSAITEYNRKHGIEVMTDGRILFADASGVRCFDKAGKELFLLDNSANFTYTPGKIILLNEENNCIETYNENGVLQSSEPSGLNLGKYRAAVFKDSLYLMGENGLLSQKSGGSLWQNLIEKSSISMSSVVPDSMYITEINGKEAFYVHSHVDYNNSNLYCYYFDETAPVVYENDLTIFSLNDNITLRQAISVFRQMHPNTSVHFVVAEDTADSAAKSEVIRLLNDELLAGKGADLLILDELPMDYYIENGILSDLSSVINPLTSNGTLLNNIVADYTTNGKIYAVPAKLSIPLVYGNADLIENMSSITKLADYVDGLAKMPFDLYYDDVEKAFFNLYANEIITEGKLNEAAFRSYLRLTDHLMKKAGKDKSSTFSTIYRSENIPYALCDGFGSYIGETEDSSTRVNLISTYSDLYIPCSAELRNFMTCTSFNQLFVGLGTAGINAASANKELAEEFLNVLLSEDVQKAQISDGFSVNQNVLNEVLTYDRLPSMNVWSSFESGHYKYRRPYKRQIESLAKTLRTVNTSYTCNETMTDAVIEAVRKYRSQKAAEETIITEVTKLVNSF